LLSSFSDGVLLGELLEARTRHACQVKCASCTKTGADAGAAFRPTIREDGRGEEGVDGEQGVSECESHCFVE